MTETTPAESPPAMAYQTPEKTKTSVDRHLKDAFKKMGWVSSSPSSEDQMSLIVEAWLDKALWGMCNNVVAGLRQLWTEHKELMRQVAAARSPDHVKILEKCCHNCNYM